MNGRLRRILAVAETFYSGRKLMKTLQASLFLHDCCVTIEGSYGGGVIFNAAT